MGDNVKTINSEECYEGNRTLIFTKFRQNKDFFPCFQSSVALHGLDTVVLIIITAFKSSLQHGFDLMFSATDAHTPSQYTRHSWLLTALWAFVILKGSLSVALDKGWLSLTAVVCGRYSDSLEQRFSTCGPFWGESNDCFTWVAKDHQKTEIFAFQFIIVAKLWL